MQKTTTLINRFDFEKPLSELVVELQTLLETHGTNPELSNLRFEDVGYDDTWYMLVANREETPEEKKERIRLERQRCKQARERVRQEAIRLGLIGKKKKS